jgi:branched-chain amino acid aminotransferase
MAHKDVSTMKIAGKVWKNGKLIDWDDARIHVMSHVVNYGSSVFEGIRAYETEQGTAVFRLKEHIQRLMNSAKVYRMEPKFGRDEIIQGVVDLIADSGLESCYIRPVIFRSLDEEKPAFGVNPFPNPVDTYVAAWQWGKYLGEEALETGIDVCVSSWTRITSNSLPTMAKAGANYMNSQLMKMEAIVNGFVEGIALDTNGYVSEGSGENIFAVKDGTVITPPGHASILPGITRDTVMTLCRDLGIPIVERSMPREFLYIADELFFTGTAAEISPIRSVDRIQVGAGRRGPVTERLQQAFFDVTAGRTEDRHGWLTPVPVLKTAVPE